MSEVIGIDVPDNVLDFFEKPLVEYSVDELLELKHDLYNKLVSYERKAAEYKAHYKYDYNYAMLYTDWEDVLGNSKPTEKVKQSYASIAADDNKKLFIQYENDVNNLKYQLDLLDNLIWFRNQQMELLLNSNE